MAVIRANSESINDRRSVLGFTVRSEYPLFEIGLATEPELLRAENRDKRTANNFYSSQLQRVFSHQRNEAVYLVPPEIMARFVGQSRLYFGLATYGDNERSMPNSVQVPDRGNMYVSLAGLTERGLRRGIRSFDRNNGYGNGTPMSWGGDAQATKQQTQNGTANSDGRISTSAPSVPASNGANAPLAAAAAYSDGFSDDLWQRPAQRPANPHANNEMARALLISQYDQYSPQDTLSALAAQVGFFLRSANWFVGVGKTNAMPHAAICQIRVPNGSEEGGLHGTGFFIAPRLIMTAAHVVAGQSRLIVVPGKCGEGISSETEPFGRFEVVDFIQHPSYSGNSDFDMAIIRVPEAQAVGPGRYFDLVDELTVCREEGAVVCGYAARWQANDAIERFVNDNINPNLQHAMGGHIRDIPTDETFTYDIQTLGGTSGSPVYWLEGNAQTGIRMHVVGVHVAAHDERTNLGCRMTAEKLRWIRQCASNWGMTVSFALANQRASAFADATPDEEDADHFGIDAPLDEDEGTQAYALSTPRLQDRDPEYPQALRFAPAHPRNYTRGRRKAIDRIVIHITGSGNDYESTIAWFQNPNQLMGKQKKPVRVSAHYVIGRGGEVVQMVAHGDTAHHASNANSRSIGIEHNATANNRRVPTDAQYRHSAKLVAWLCAQFGVPVDRAHIVGHAEIDTKTTHRDCPNSVWDWDTYMRYVGEETAALTAATPAAVAQSLGRRQRSYASAQEMIAPYYDPANPASALMCQADAFSQQREEWFMGVPDTRLFPHSAICQLNMTDAAGNGYSGTGFYIGRNRILTCAHNLHNMQSVQIIPARNGAGEMPFGQTTVNASSWRIAPSYTGPGNWDNDLAVIDNVPLPAPNDRYFEFLQATPSDALPIVVCGYSAGSRAVPELDSIIDGDKQHAHGGYVRRMPTENQIDYPILSLMGASGSPVYTLTGSGSNVQAKLCAVHVSGEPASDGLNRGCFLTPSKLDWIEGRTTAFALGARSRAMEIPLDPGAGGQCITEAELAPGDMIVSTARAPQSYIIRAGTLSAVSHAMLYVGSGKVIEALGDGVREVPISEALNDAILAVAYRDPRVGYEQASAIVSYAQQQVGKPFNYDGIVRYANRVLHPFAQRIADKIRQLTGADDQQARSFFCSELIFAAFQAAGIPLTASRPDTNAPEAIVELAQHGLRYVGHLVAHDEFLGIPLGFAQGIALSRGLSQEIESACDYDVPLVPQHRKDAGGAAAMAMLMAFRRNTAIAPDALMRENSANPADSANADMERNALARYGFRAIAQPENGSLYHAPRQWARWLHTQGPLWVSIAGSPYAVVIAGIRGDLDDASRCEVKLLNPWNVETVFDNDPVQFRPANTGQKSWMSFADFVAEFGQLAREDYGNWRVLSLPENAAGARADSNGTTRLMPAPAAVRVQGLSIDSSGGRESIEPSRIAGTRMYRVSGQAGACRWALEQLEGMKRPTAAASAANSANAIATTIRLDDWPAIDGASTPLPLTLTFASTADNSVGEVRIEAGTPTQAAHGVDVQARIDNAPDTENGIAVVSVRIDYRFSGLAQGAPEAWIELRLRGDGRYERDNGWRNDQALLSAA